MRWGQWIRSVFARYAAFSYAFMLGLCNSRVLSYREFLISWISMAVYATKLMKGKGKEHGKLVQQQKLVQENSPSRSIEWWNKLIVHYSTCKMLNKIDGFEVDHLRLIAIDALSLLSQNPTQSTYFIKQPEFLVPAHGVNSDPNSSSIFAQSHSSIQQPLRSIFNLFLVENS